MIMVPDFRPFFGDHCETNTTGSLLKHAGLEMSEPMLFGIGEGLAFVLAEYEEMPAPYLSGRVRGEAITKALARHLGLKVEYRTTRSKVEAWENISAFIDAGQAVGVKIDMYFLDYSKADVHFAGHYVPVYGYDQDNVYVADTRKLGGMLTNSRSTFEKGRLWRGPMASDALTYTVALGGDIDWPSAIRSAIVSNAETFLNPPNSSFGAAGIRKAAGLAPTWLDTLPNAPGELKQMGKLMERGGTGGAQFRNFYRDFLTEANTYLNSPTVSAARDQFAESALLWTELSDKLIRAGSEGPERLVEAADLLLRLADLEEAAFTNLSSLQHEPDQDFGEGIRS